MPPESRKPLGSLARLFLPGKSDNDLLRACLLEGDAARAAFDAWVESRESAAMQTGAGAKRRMLPLLSASLNRNKILPPSGLRPLLRASQMYEELRTREYREIAGEVLKKLRVAGLPFLATGGVSFAVSLYGEDEYRHCHDIDLLVGEDSVAAVEEILRRECGFAVKDLVVIGRGDRVLYHGSGLPVVLHCHSARVPVYEYPLDALLRRAVVQRGHGTEFETLSPEDGLLHAVLLAAGGTQNGGLIWLCDAWKLVASGQMHWERLMEAAGDSYRLLPLVETLEYLSEAGAPVPVDVVNEFRASLDRQNVAEIRQAREVLVHGLQISFAGGRKALLRQRVSFSERILLLRCFVFPSAKVLRSVGEIEALREAPLYWARRVLRGVLRRLGGKFGNSERRDSAVADQQD